MKFVPPSVRDKAFNCPHCGALAAQRWYSLGARRFRGDSPLPQLMTPEHRATLKFSDVEDPVKRQRFNELADKLATRVPVLDSSGSVDSGFLVVFNLFLSECFNCREVSIWIFDRLVYPQTGEAPPANSDLSEDIRRDYNEASSILDRSPRGAAALIRLAIQKLCRELGKSGKDLNADIGALVADGLEKQVQMALDAVRVIGNNAVHPGQIDLRDDRATAQLLFELLNLIAEKMITQPRRVKTVYESLPDGALKAIADRDR